MTKRQLEVSSTIEDYCEGRIDIDQLIGDNRNFLLANWKEEFVHPTTASRLLTCQLIESETDQKYLFNLVDALPLEHQPEFKMFGRKCRMRRDVGFFAEDGVPGYAYAGQTSVAAALPTPLARFMTLINHICGASFNGILINRYNGGDDYISPHSDNESDLEPDVGVVAISLGAVRTMNFKTKTTPFVSHDIDMANGSALCMNGTRFQRDYTHGIRPTKKVIGQTPFQSKDERRRAMTRISLTLRKHTRVTEQSALLFKIPNI